MSPHRRSRLAALGAVLVLTASTVALTAAPADAHDLLLSSSPAAGARLDTAPAYVTLTFSDAILDLGDELIVADAKGTDWSAGAPVIDRDEISVGLKAGMPAAGYQLRWRIVSADGHPVSGVIPFTVGDDDRATDSAAAPTPTPTASADAKTGVGGGAGTGTGSTGARTGSATASTAESGEPRADPLGALRVALIGLGGAALAIGAYAAVLALRRRRA